jgi:hypothetical protein
MKKALIVSSLVLVGLWIAGSAFAADFSADMVMTSGGKTTTSKVFTKGDKSRMEPQGQPTYSIVRNDKKLMWMVMTDQKAYMEMTADPKQAPQSGDKVTGEVSRKLIGKETIDGRSTEKYEVTFKDGNKTEKMYQWMATDLKFPVKMAAVDGSWTMEYKNIKMGAQADSLFEVPSGYKKMAMPAMPQMPKMPK